MSKSKAAAKEEAPEEQPAAPPAEEPAAEPAAGDEEPTNPTPDGSEDTSSTTPEESEAGSEDTPELGEPTKAPDREIVDTALNPDTWPSQTSGTVTDPEVLRRHGLEPKAETVGSTAAVTVGSLPQPVPEQPSSQHELFRCLVRQLPTNHAPFWSDAHRKGERLACPECDSDTVIRADGVATA